LVKNIFRQTNVTHIIGYWTPSNSSPHVLGRGINGWIDGEDARKQKKEGPGSLIAFLKEQSQ
jgi:hypothetical protein